MGACCLSRRPPNTIDLLAGKGYTQSVLSMWWHDRLGVAVRELGIHLAFRRVDGLRAEEAGGEKAEFMVRHLAALGVDAADVVMVGDSVDDAAAARACSARGRSSTPAACRRGARIWTGSGCGSSTVSPTSQWPTIRPGYQRSFCRVRHHAATDAHDDDVEEFSWTL